MPKEAPAPSPAGNDDLFRGVSSGPPHAQLGSDVDANRYVLPVILAVGNVCGGADL